MQVADENREAHRELCEGIWLSAMISWPGGSLLPADQDRRNLPPSTGHSEGEAPVIRQLGPGRRLRRRFMGDSAAFLVFVGDDRVDAVAGSSRPDAAALPPLQLDPPRSDASGSASGAAGRGRRSRSSAGSASGSQVAGLRAGAGRVPRRATGRRSGRGSG